jgi:hypothetical protein
VWVGDVNALAMNSNDNNYGTGQLVDFLTSAPGETLDETSDVDPTQYANSETHAPYEQWMKRYIQIAQFPWTEDTELITTFAPYSLYLNNPNVLKKLEGFSRFHMKGLEVKFLLNGAPTQYGSVLVSYKPLPGFSGGDIDQTPGTLPYFLGHTCYPHSYLSVATSVGATMKLPFVCPQNCITGPSIGDNLISQTDELGTMYMSSIGALRSVGSPAVAPIIITVYARPIDLFMWGPTSYIMQSDEYGVKPVSTIASVIASAAGMLSTVPLIGPYMLATQIASGAMASIARLFGYSNPPVIDPVHVFANRPTYGISSPEIPFQMDKLSLDPKNELTVDPRTVGAPTKDGMLMSNMMDRDVYIGDAIWYSTDTPGAAIISSYVTPEQARVTPGHTGTTGPIAAYYTANKVQMTPSCHLAQMFKYWRGPIHYTFTVIASQFHRGRYVIEYEPAGATAYDGQGRIRQWVVDIKDTPTFTVTIDMCSATTWLPTQRTAFTAGASDNQFITARSKKPTFDNLDANGTLRVLIVNDLTSSAASTDVLMFVRMNCKDVEFACPMDLQGAPTTYNPQSDTADLAATTMEETTAHESVETRETPQDSVIYHGEVVKSVRTLLQRATYFRTLNSYPKNPISDVLRNTITKGYAFLPEATTWSKVLVKWVFPRVGTQVGNVTGSMWATVGAGTPGATASSDYIYGKPTFMAYLTPCYVGYRGGVGYRIAIDANNASPIKVEGVTIERSEVPLAAYLTGLGSYGTAFGHADAFRNQQYLDNTKSGASGLAVTNDVRYVDAVVPHYSRYRMLPALPTAQMNLAQGLGVPFVSEIDNLEVTGTLTGNFLTTPPTDQQWMTTPSLNVYQQAGVDFTLLYYLAPPTMYTLKTAASRP